MTDSPLCVRFRPAEPYPSGMVVEQVESGPVPAAWPFQASRWVVPAHVTNELDRHDVTELWLVSDGQGIIRSGEHTMSVTAGDMVLMPSRVPHQLTNTGDTPFKVFSLWWQGSDR